MVFRALLLGLVLAGILIGGRILARRGVILVDRTDPPTCHKNLEFSLRVWMHDPAQNPGKSDDYPNVNGESAASIIAASSGFGPMLPVVIRDYKYVPGLRVGDPAKLILTYFNRPTRWIMHTRPEPIWEERLWVVVPLGLSSEPNPRKALGRGPHQRVYYGEMSESLTTEQFTNRLIATLKFLQTNERPHWQNVLKEHSAFLETIPAK